MRHHWARKVFHDLETNPQTQITFHFIMMAFWVINFVAGAIVVALFPHLWITIGVFYVFSLSIYANFDTDYGAVSAAQAYLYSESVSTSLKVEVSDSSPQTIDVVMEQTESHVASGTGPVQ